MASMRDTLCVSGLSSSPVTASSCHSKRFGSALGLWGLRAFSISLSLSSLVCFCFRQVNKAFWLRLGPVGVFLCHTEGLLSPVLCEHLCVFVCVYKHAFDLNQLSTPLPDSYSCHRKGSGLVLDQCQAMCAGWSAHHTLYLVPERVPACT